MSLLGWMRDWLSRGDDQQRLGSREFSYGHVLADAGELAGALDSFSAVSRSADEWKAARFNQAVLLARLGYVADAEVIFRELADKREATEEYAVECSDAKQRGQRTDACHDVALRGRDSALVAYEAMRQHDIRHARIVDRAFQEERDRRRASASGRRDQRTVPNGDTIRIKKVTPLYNSVVGTLLKVHPNLTPAQVHELVLSALTLTCPSGCGQYSREMVEMCILAGENGAWEQAAGVIPTGPIGAAFQKGRCYNCGTTKVTAHINEARLQSK